MKKPPPEIIEMDASQFEELMRRAEQQTFEQEDYATIRRVLQAYLCLLELVDNKSTTIGRLRKLLFGASTEKTADVVGRETPAATDKTPPPPVSSSGGEPHSGDEKKPRKKPGHGRNGADRYAGASRVKVRHASLKPGDACPECEAGTAYLMAKPGVLVRFIGQPPLAATIYELEKLRCNFLLDGVAASRGCGGGRSGRLASLEPPRAARVGRGLMLAFSAALPNPAPPRPSAAGFSPLPKGHKTP